MRNFDFCPPFPSRRLLLAGAILLPWALAGCGSSGGYDRALDPDLARKSVELALQAWVDGKKPADLKPAIIIGDPAWDSGRKLVAFQLIADKEKSDGSNLHIVVLREFRDGQGASRKSETTYIVGTSPVVSIFPQ